MASHVSKICLNPARSSQCPLALKPVQFFQLPLYATFHFSSNREEDLMSDAYFLFLIQVKIIYLLSLLIICIGVVFFFSNVVYSSTCGVQILSMVKFMSVIVFRTRKKMFLEVANFIQLFY